jgi:hypothetical protein
MTDAELHAFIRTADPNIRQGVADAALVPDLRDLQLSPLSSTYPGWDIDYESDAHGEAPPHPGPDGL